MTSQNPAFGHAQIRDLTEVFVGKAIEASPVLLTCDVYSFLLATSDAGYPAE